MKFELYKVPEKSPSVGGDGVAAGGTHGAATESNDARGFDARTSREFGAVGHGE